MNNIILVIGGQKSGKSLFAEKKAVGLVSGEEKPLYLATAVAFDEEMERRIKAHRLRRNDKFDTVEEKIKIAHVLEKCFDRYDVILLECLTLWMNNLLYYCSADDMEKEVKEFKVFLENFRKSFPAEKTLIVVSNETGMGITPDSQLSRTFVDMAGALNAEIATAADEVYFMISGISLRIK